MGRILFAGDTFLHEETNGLLLSKDLFDKCGEFDFFCANIEGPSGKNDFTRGLGFKFRDNCIRQIARAGINVAILGNNHIYDCGEYGIEDTIRQCAEKGINTVGAGLKSDAVYKPLILTTRDGYRIAFFSAQHRYYGSVIGDNECGTADIWDHRLFSNIADIRDKCDYIIVNAHCGLENHYYPLDTWKNQLRLLVDVGADIIIGHHPHVILGDEEYKGKRIVYSLGNFAFDIDKKYESSVSEDWNKGLVAVVDIDGNHEFSISYLEGFYTEGVFRIKGFSDGIKIINTVNDRKVYYRGLEREFDSYLREIRMALFRENIDYRVLHHYLALDEQRIVIQEYLEGLFSGAHCAERGPKWYELDIYPIIIWGCGNNGRSFFAYAQRMGYKILGFTDSYATESREMTICGRIVKVFSHNELMRIKSRYNMIVATMYYDEIKNLVVEYARGNGIFHYEDVFYRNYGCELASLKQMNWDYREDEFNGIKYRLYNEGGLPIVLYLHGAGSCGNDNIRQVSNMGNLGRAIEKLSDATGCSVYAPQCPQSNMWMGFDYEAGHFNYNELLCEENIIDDILEHITQSAEERDIYLIGYSIGGFAAWYSMMRFPTLFKGAIIISAGGDPTFPEIQMFKDRVLLLHGNNDSDVPVFASREMAKASGCRYIEYDGYDHDLQNSIEEDEWFELLKTVYK